MIAVIFEVVPAEGKMGHYLDYAGALAADLQEMDGFICAERFQSLTEPEKLLSLSFWRDEAAVKAWRNHPVHRVTQAKGRLGLFRHYRLRVAAVVRDYGLHERGQAPQDSRAAHG
ncbi:antibiotic biosynthesis monooxygenase family protein [Devosia nitrariae]|uniref:Antibiotic biosynthesis monooxygenase n=1 Tax=Devosia nitrariae TaxID=2071872 RepID=A0ABQ5W743_9HYPH|nr:antibiotic biosynthesis monooxygenase [Devosia nitrariae]GLQ55755.1 antibiotic biosynthesis monooxygenase [Devosia nitrariae]